MEAIIEIKESPHKIRPYFAIILWYQFHQLLPKASSQEQKNCHYKKGECQQLPHVHVKLDLLQFEKIKM